MRLRRGNIMMRTLIFIVPLVMVLSLLPNSQGQNNSINRLIEKYRQSKSLINGQWSVVAKSVTTGKTIIDFQGHQSLAPASGLKLFTSAAALDRLGGNFRIQTPLYYSGDIDSKGVLHGDVILVGKGDPTLGSTIIKKSRPLNDVLDHWVNALQKSGIKQIKGHIIVDISIFNNNRVPGYWPWIDIGNYYGAGTSALSIHDNLYYLHFRPGRSPGMPAKIRTTEPKMEGLNFKNFIKTGTPGSGDQGYIYCAPGQNTAVLRGTIPAGFDTFTIKGSMPDPALFAAKAFKKRLETSGVDVQNTAITSATNRTYDENKRLCIIQSPPLRDIIYILNKKSVNLYAEQLVKLMDYKTNQKPGDLNRGLKIIKKFLNEQDIDTSSITLFDGSGLSRTNRISALAMAELLLQMTKHSEFTAFYESLGIAGDANESGSYKNFGENTIIAGNARVKTGLINGVRSHSGYVKSQSGEIITFSMIANNYDGHLYIIDQFHENLLIHIAKNY
ncbi:MAG: D-alanyl-D-alanine carboxypeptidase/D-alanyl-D-alanine-endopeptidase [Caldithrix sp.]|nr:D-alanyl-D-alanine carboxypeptidase/D-alanyl-D-alanine-endopeptidase [Caldithrix sp.]